jgi:hypothetical protein
MVACVPLVGEAAIASAQSANPHGGAGVVAVSGMVGPLRLNISTPVVALALLGPAEFVGTGTWEEPGVLDYLVLGYECSRSKSAGGIDPGAYRRSGTHCRIAYYFDAKTNTLGAFWTSSPRFRTPAGTRPGMRGSEAANREGKEATSGCHQSIWRRSSTADLNIEIVGGRTVATPPGSGEPVRLVGGKVSELQLESRKRHVGLLFC